MDLQSLQAPYLTYTFIVIQAFCFFFSIWFWAFFISTWWSHCKCLSCLPVWSGTAGYSAWCRQDQGSLCRARCYLWECVTPHQAALRGSSISPGSSLLFVPSAFGGKVSVWWEWRQWCLCNSCTRICQHRSQDASHKAQNRCPSVTPLLITGYVCMDLKPGFFHVPQLERWKKHLPLLTYTQKKYLLGIIVMIWLPLSSCMVFLFCVSFFLSIIKYLKTLSRFGIYTYPRPTYSLFSE